MPSAFGHSDAMRAAPAITMITGSVDDGMPLSNLYSEQPGMRTRFVGSPIRFVVDFGAPVSAGVVVVGNTTLDATGVVNFYASLTEMFGPYEVFSEAVETTGAARSRGQAVLLRPANESFRYLRVHLNNAPGGVVDVGFLAVMRLLNLPLGHDFGAGEGRLPLGIRDSNPVTGASFRVPGLARPRTARFTTPNLVAGEYYGALRDLMDDLTLADDLLWVPDTNLSQAELNRRCIYGDPQWQPGQAQYIDRPGPLQGSAAFTLVERV